MEFVQSYKLYPFSDYEGENVKTDVSQDKNQIAANELEGQTFKLRNTTFIVCK